MSKQAAKDLREARAIIADPSRWTTGVAARKATGEKTSPLDGDAASFCAIGAIMRAAVGNPFREQAAQEFLYAYLEEAQPGRYITAINDTDGHEAVLNMFDKAIALAEASS
jgi:hypothetical protein